MFVNIAPPSDQLFLDLGGALANFLFEIGHDRLRRRRLRPARDQERCKNGEAKKAPHVSLHEPKFPDKPDLRRMVAILRAAQKSRRTASDDLNAALVKLGRGELQVVGRSRANLVQPPRPPGEQGPAEPPDYMQQTITSRRDVLRHGGGVRLSSFAIPQAR